MQGMISTHFTSLCLFAAAGSLVILSNFLVYIMVGQVNRRLSDEEQVNYLFWYPGKLARLKKLYRQLYPEGRLVLLFHLCAVLAGLFFLAFVWKFGFFG